ncbi:hypothetical protein DsansV1_C36g0232011 [Dioscorea sansibarensis]
MKFSFNKPRCIVHLITSNHHGSKENLHCSFNNIKSSRFKRKPAKVQE